MQPTLMINGAAGRMGKRILSLAVESKAWKLVGAADCARHPDLGKDAGMLAGCEKIGIALNDRLEGRADVLIDFSLPAAADASIAFCGQNKTALVLGTTGLTPSHFEQLKKAAGSIAIVQASNMSLGMNLLFTLVGRVAKGLGPEYDIEIVEAHHRMKKDAPSGSALSLAQSICQETGRDFPDCLVHGREGKDALRQKGTIGMHALRGGDIVGRHSVIYSTQGETVTISHDAHSRDTFARGALRAAQWLLDKPAGLYSMQDVLGLK